MHDLRNALQQKIQRLPVRYFDDHPFGDVLSRVTNDVDALSNALQQTLTRVFGAILTFVFVIFMMLRINAVMTLIALIIIPLALLISRVVVSHSQRLFDEQQNTLGNSMEPLRKCTAVLMRSFIRQTGRCRKDIP